MTEDEKRSITLDDGVGEHVDKFHYSEFLIAESGCLDEDIEKRIAAAS